MTRDDRHKLVLYHGNDYEPVHYGELYDMQEDPEEHVNLWDDPGHAGVRERITSVIEETAPITEDPAERIGRF